MKPSLPWSAFWIALGLIAFAGEMIALALNGATDSLSSQVWFVVGLSPWVFYPAMIAFGGGGAVLVWHFFGHRRQA